MNNVAYNFINGNEYPNLLQCYIHNNNIIFNEFSTFRPHKAQPTPAIVMCQYNISAGIMATNNI